MQIFSPLVNFKDIANCLDKKRLLKQKVEMWNILEVTSLGDKAKEWKNHPAVKMARGFELFFIDYGLEIANKCSEYGWKDTLIHKIKAFKDVFKGNDKVPFYWGNDKFHSSHRAALLFKKFDYYKQFAWEEEPIIKYFWPISK